MEFGKPNPGPALTGVAAGRGSIGGTNGDARGLRAQAAGGAAAAEAEGGTPAAGGGRPPATGVVTNLLNGRGSPARGATRGAPAANWGGL